jgi:hypothetical protein
MIFTMTSKEMDLFLNNETDESILDAQYVIVSNRIRRRGIYDNAITANVLFPDPLVMMNISTGDIVNAYYNQLSKNKTLLAVLISDVIIHKHNIIFLCTKNEFKLCKHLDLIANFIYNEFEYPVYRYKDLAKGNIDIIDYDESKVYKKCMKIVNESKHNQIIANVKNDRKLKDNEKKKLKKILKQEGLYKKGMSISEMKDIVDVFINEMEGW